MEKVLVAQGEKSLDVAAKVARVLNVSPEQIVTFSKESEYDRLMNLVKTKINATKNKREIVKFLTLAPVVWSVNKVALEFQVSRYLVRKARKLVRAKGILEMPEKYVGHGISDETKSVVAAFYEDDDNSRSMPGAKDFVSVGRNNHVQKRLLLCNINELFVKFKKEHPHIKICRSTFASLRPKWCVTVATSGSHSVCVCVYHQNVKLMLDACKFPTDQHSLTDKIVCDRNNRECMILRCKHCPVIEILREHLLGQFHKLRPCLDDSDETSGSCDDKEEEEQQIKLSQWVSTDHADIIKQKLPISEFVELLVEKFDALTAHSFVAYVKRVRSNLGDGELLCWMTLRKTIIPFIVQYVAQAYHWNSNLHPVMIYYHNKDTGVIEGSPVSVLLKHFLRAVWQP